MKERIIYFLKQSVTKINGVSYKDALNEKKVMLPLAVNGYSRLRHTKDVNKIATKISEQLKKKYFLMLNNKKLQTMVDWHDVGHCPYAHAGEEELNRLLAEEGDFYYDSFYSGYKHNLLSAKILLDEDVNISWDIIDGIIKHSNCLPSNFNISRVSEYNLLKLNYIFRQKSIGKNDSWHNFISRLFSLFPCEKCDIVKKDMDTIITNNKFSICMRKGKQTEFCCLSNDLNGKDGTNISKYLLYPYSLTLEGACLYWADEIACLSNDLYHYYHYVKTGINGNQQYIIKSKIDNALSILKVTYNDNTVARQLFSCIDFLFDNIQQFTDTTYLAALQDFLIQNLVIQSYEKVATVGNVDILVSFNSNGECDSLIKLDSCLSDVFAALKKVIYDIIHKDSLIVEDNKLGVEALREKFTFYYENPSEFFSIIENQPLIQELQQIIIQNDRRDFLNGRIEDEIENDRNNEESLESMKLLNAFRREIVFYLAKLRESDL